MTVHAVPPRKGLWLAQGQVFGVWGLPSHYPPLPRFGFSPAKNYSTSFSIARCYGDHDAKNG